jgi:hypothetical protein
MLLPNEDSSLYKLVRLDMPDKEDSLVKADWKLLLDVPCAAAQEQ